MKEELIERAQEISYLSPVAGKNGLFLIRKLSNDVEGCFLDLRKGFSVYKYDGESGEQVNYSEYPDEIKKMQKEYKAQGNAKLGEFA